MELGVQWTVVVVGRYSTCRWCAPAVSVTVDVRMQDRRVVAIGGVGHVALWCDGAADVHEVGGVAEAVGIGIAEEPNRRRARGIGRASVLTIRNQIAIRIGSAIAHIGNVVAIGVREFTRQDLAVVDDAVVVAVGGPFVDRPQLRVARRAIVPHELARTDDADEVVLVDVVVRLAPPARSELSGASSAIPVCESPRRTIVPAPPPGGFGVVGRREVLVPAKRERRERSERQRELLEEDQLRFGSYGHQTSAGLSGERGGLCMVLSCGVLHDAIPMPIPPILHAPLHGIAGHGRAAGCERGQTNAQH